MRKTMFIAFLILIIVKSHGQQLVIKYEINKDSSFHTKKNKSIGNNLLGIVRNNWDKFDPISPQSTVISRSFFLEKPTLEIDVISYKIKGSGTYFIQDIFGHEILIDPSLIKDTLQLSLNQNHFYKNSSDGDRGLYLNDSISSSAIFTVIYPYRYKYVGFFDSLNYLHGGLHEMQDGYSFKSLNHDLPKYLTGINRIYRDRMKFFWNFVQKYSMPLNLQLYAKKEIQYSYFNDLLTPLVEWDSNLYSDYPRAIRDTINNFKNDLNDTALFESTSLHRVVLAKYLGLMNRGSTHGPLNFDQTFLDSILSFTKSNLKGEVKAYVIAWLTQVYYGKGDEVAANILYQNYEPDPACPTINKLVDSIYQLAKHPGFSPAEMLNLTFENNLHIANTLSKIVAKKVILIDCWATWCIPCRKQIPFLNTIIEKYKSQVQFVALSADEDVGRWDSWIKKNNSGEPGLLQLHADGGFNNVFFKRLFINEIPRYILLSASGQVLNSSMPMPGEQISFEKELKKYL